MVLRSWGDLAVSGKLCYTQQTAVCSRWIVRNLLVAFQRKLAESNGTLQAIRLACCGVLTLLMLGANLSW